MTSADRIRLAIFVPHTGMSGAEVNIINLLRRLPADQFDIYLIAPDGQPLRQIAHDHGHHVCDYRKPRFFSTSLELGQRRIFNPVATLYNLFIVLRDSFRLRQILNKHQIQVLYTGAMMAHLMGYLVRRSNQAVRLVIHLQELVSSSLGRQIFRIIAQGADQIIAVSAAVSKLVQKSKPVTIIYNGVDLDLFQVNLFSTLRDELRIPTDRPIIGVVGRLTPWKGHKIFLEAAHKLVQKGLNSHFVIVGDSVDPVTGASSYRATLETYCNELALRDHVAFLGHRTDISNIMSGLDVLVVPSVRPEPFGLVTVEAMACGKPVVVSNTGGLPEIVVDLFSGKLFTPGDPVALAEALAPIITDPALRSRYGKAARERVETCFTLDHYAGAMSKVFVETVRL